MLYRRTRFLAPGRSLRGDGGKRMKTRFILLLLVFIGITGCSPEQKKQLYQCPMHPSVVSDRPGSCPICGMDLVPIEKIGGQTAANLPRSDVPGLAVISISEQKRQVIGLKLAAIEKRPLAREIRTSARVLADETKLWRVTTKIEGWVEQLFVSYTGQRVEKGEPLLSIYSPELVSAQSEYVAALRVRENLSDPLVVSARRRLERWDISDEQLERLTKSRRVEKALTLQAPASGVVLEKNVLPGEKITMGNPLMVIADLSVVWADADIYQSDLPHVREGMPLSMSLPYWPGKTFEGKLIFISPTVDAESRTLRARLEIPNPELLLKPGMFGDAKLSYELGEKLSIPATAVMVSAEHTYAFRDLGDSHLVPVLIQIGARSGDSYELLKGLKEGDQVVASANFLVDSESNLKAGLEAIGGAAAPHQHSAPEAPTPAPSTPHKHVDLGNALEPYLALQRSLALDDLSASQAAAKTLEASGLTEASTIAAASSLKEARKVFKTISEQLIGAAQHAAPSRALFVFECPMALEDGTATWLQETRELRNPYQGAAMLKCGELKEQLGRSGTGQ